MTENNLNEEEILRVLELLQGGSYLFERCLSLITDKNDSIEMYRRNIALLDEQILAKDKEIAILTINMNAFGLGMKREKEKAYTARAKAIKEFAERMKEYIYESDDINHITDWGIDQIAKEMGVE